MDAKLALVIEDDLSARKLLQDALEGLGLRVVCATDGPSGLVAAQHLGVDLIVMDVILPGLGGIDVTERLKSQPATSNIPILIITARNGEEQRAIGAGASAFLAKPFDLAALETRVGACLAGANLPPPDTRPTEPPKRETA